MSAGLGISYFVDYEVGMTSPGALDGNPIYWDSATFGYSFETQVMFISHKRLKQLHHPVDQLMLSTVLLTD